MRAAAPADRGVGWWLVGCAAMVFAMVVIGGIARLTESGLSMVEWRPVLGVLPPFADAEWQRIFEAYRASPQYRDLNAGMTFGDFKTIFWWEYVHRLWGRLIGVVFIVPLVWFALRGRLSGRLGMRLAALFLLGGLQGLLGWYMVQSGLVDEPRVSPLRLAAHLLLALVILSGLLWTAFDLLAARTPAPADRRLPRVRALALATLAALTVTVVSGAFVAGTDAGLTYNTFPLMDGDLVPAGYFATADAVFADIATVQFHHRVLALVTLALALATWWQSRWLALAPRGRAVANALALLAAAQVALGVATLLAVVPVPLAALHQATAVALFGGGVWFLFEVRAHPVAAPTLST